MLILLFDNKIVGVTEQRDNIPDGYTVYEYPEVVDIRLLYYDVTDTTVKHIPPRPDLGENERATWDGSTWVIGQRNVFRPSPKDSYIGSNLYRWAKTRSASDNNVMLLHVTAMCCDAADVRDELRDAVRDLREIRNANANA